MATPDHRKSISEQLEGCGFVDAWVEDFTWPAGTFTLCGSKVDVPIASKVAIKKAVVLVPYETAFFSLVGKINSRPVGDFGAGQVLIAGIETGGRMTLLIRDVRWNHPALPRLYDEIEFP